MSEDREVHVDCDEGRRLGCGTFCCSLIVRYAPDEVVVDAAGQRKACVDKDKTTGACVHLDREHFGCAIWEERPRVCRQYDCNDDPLLQVVLRDGFRSLVSAARADVPRGPRRVVPRRRSRA